MLNFHPYHKNIQKLHDTYIEAPHWAHTEGFGPDFTMQVAIIIQGKELRQGISQTGQGGPEIPCLYDWTC